MKCDEQVPVCQNCLKSNRKCFRGVRLNFIQYSFYDPKISVNAENIKILDQSITIANLYNGQRFYNSYLSLHNPADLKQSDEVFKRDCELSGSFGLGDERRENLIGSISGTTSAATAARAAAIAAASSSPTTAAPATVVTTSSGSRIVKSDSPGNALEVGGGARSTSAGVAYMPSGHQMAPGVDNIAAIDKEQEEHEPPEEHPPPQMARFNVNRIRSPLKLKPDSMLSDQQNPQTLVASLEQASDSVSTISNKPSDPGSAGGRYLDRDPKASAGSSDDVVVSEDQGIGPAEAVGIHHVSGSPRDDFEFNPLSRPGTSVDSPFFNEDLINNFQVPNLSSFSIQNFLLKPKNQFEPPNLSTSKIIFDNPNFEFDVNKFIKLIDGEKYYWLLDLFNELGIWKSLVPNYCLNLIHTNANSPNNNISHLIKLHETKHSRVQTQTPGNTSLVDTSSNSNVTPTADEMGPSPIESTSSSPPGIVYTNQSDYHHLINNTFLVNCLLNCSVEAFTGWANFKFLLKLQLNYFNVVKKLTISGDTFKNFEILLVSIVFNLFNLLLKIIHNVRFTKLFNIFNNQVKIFNKIIFKFFKLPNHKFKRFRSLIFTSAVHSIIILKHLILKHWYYSQNQSHTMEAGEESEMKEGDSNLDLSPEDIKEESNEQALHDGDKMHVDNSNNYYLPTRFQKPIYKRSFRVPRAQASSSKSKVHVYDDNTNIDSVNWNEDLNEPIDYESYDEAPIRKLNYFEVLQLNDNFNGLELSQAGLNDPNIRLNYTNHSQSSNDSNALKLRKLIWHSIKLDYSKQYPNFQSFSINNSIVPQIGPLQPNSILPNDRLTLYLLFSQYLWKTAFRYGRGSGSADSHTVIADADTNIRCIFQVIENSMISDDLKQFWANHFRWMVDTA